MKIRLAVAEDRNVLVRDYLQQVHPDLEMAQRYAEQHIRIDRALLLEEDAVVIGTLTWGLREHPRHGLAELTGLRVAASRRGQGQGKLLLQKGLEDMRSFFAGQGAELRAVYGFVGREQAACRGLLEQAGFRIGEGRPGAWLAVWAPSPS